MQSCKPVGGASPKEGSGAIGTSVVYEKIKATKLFPDLPKETGDLIWLGEIGVQTKRGSTLEGKLTSEPKGAVGAAAMVKNRGVA